MDALPWTRFAAILATIVVTLMTILHLTLRKDDFRPILRGLAVWRSPAACSQRELDQKQRYEKELHETRIRNFSQVNKAFIHLAFLVSSLFFWRLIHRPSRLHFAHFLLISVGYVVHNWYDGRVTSHSQMQILKAIFCLFHMTCALSLLWEEDLLMFCCCEKFLAAGMGFLNMFMLDFKILVPFYLLQAIMLSLRLWQLIGFHNLNLTTIFLSVASHVLCFGTIAVVELVVRSNIAAKVDSNDASSLMQSFRQVLRGVSDGDLLLEKGNCTIVDDAGCLERVLKSKKKLSETNFLDLFLDSSSRENFLHFLNAPESSGESSAIPRGLRVSLQGVEGPVSMDLFHTRVPSPAGGKDYCLLALKEDPEERAAPDARPGVIPAAVPLASGRSQASGQSRTGSEDTEIVDAYEELVEIAVLFSNETGLLDIKQVHLSFQRQSWAPTIESGMPTLRRFIRPSDWDRIEKMLHNVMSLPPAEIERRCYFRHPMLFRVPGASRSYFCSRETYISLAAVGSGSSDGPLHFQMHLSSFDGRAILRPREQELEGIDEELADESEISDLEDISESNGAISSSLEAACSSSRSC